MANNQSQPRLTFSEHFHPSHLTDTCIIGAALRAAGALSDDGESIFVAGGSSTFQSINAKTGLIQWADNNGESLYISQPNISKITQNIVYAIEVRLILLALLSIFSSLAAPLPQNIALDHSLFVLACKWKGRCLQLRHRNPAMGIRLPRINRY